MGKMNNNMDYEITKNKMESDDVFDKFDVQFKAIILIQCLGMLLNIVFEVATIVYIVSFRNMFMLSLSFR